MYIDADQDTTLKQIVVPRMPDLSPTLRLAADYVLKNSDVVAMHSLRRVAELADLNPPTFTRLAQSLGFENYEALRELCRREMQRTAGTFAGKAALLQQRTGQGNGSFLLSHAAASITNIHDLAEATNPDALAEAAEILAGSRTVVLLGSLSSAALIDYLGYMARMAFPNWRIALRNHETAVMAINELGPKDAVVALAQKPYARDAVETAKLASIADVPLIAVTDSYASPIATDATHVFVTPTESPHFFASAAAPVVLFESLLSMVVQRGGKKAQERIAAIEHGNYATGRYWSGKLSK